MMKLIAFAIFGITLIFKLVYGLFAISRLDIDSGVDRIMFINGIGHLIGFPSRPGTSSTATTGIPTNSIQGWAPGAIFFNWKGSAGSVFYVNIGTFASSNWQNVATWLFLAINVAIFALGSV